MKTIFVNSRLVFVEKGNISPQNVITSKFFNIETFQSEDNAQWQFAEIDVSNVQYIDLAITAPSYSLYDRAKVITKVKDEKGIGFEPNFQIEADKQYVFENIDVRLCDKIYVNCKNGTNIKCATKLQGQSNLIAPIVHENSIVSRAGIIEDGSYTDVYEYDVTGKDVVRITSMCNSSINNNSHQAVAMKDGSFVKLIKWEKESLFPYMEQTNIVSTKDCDKILVIARKPYGSACLVCSLIR